MYLLYSIAYSIVFLLMLPAFLLRRQKYASGFKQRLGSYPSFDQDERKVIWLHCVSVGEANAARPLVDKLLADLPAHRLVISTVTKTGQDLAKTIFADKADAVFYFPYDWRFSVRKALANYRPSLVLLMETEIWPRFIHEAKLAGSKVAIVNGRLSETSAHRYANLRAFIKRVLSDIDAALMQGEADARRLMSLGMAPSRVTVTGNLKFDITVSPDDHAIASHLDERFHFDGERPVIAAASTHEPEERWILEAYCSLMNDDKPLKPRLLIAPRHPERFESVVQLLREFRDDPSCEYPRYSFARRSSEPENGDRTADVILLDSIGELRAAYSLCNIVFVGGSLIPHGGQSVLEPAAVGKAVITGPYTHNFADVVRVFLGNSALIQLPVVQDVLKADELFLALSDLLESPKTIVELGHNAKAVMNANRGATESTVGSLRVIISKS